MTRTVLDVDDRLLDEAAEIFGTDTNLLFAATAERHSAIVLHCDGDFDMIARATGQPMQWVVPAGTAD